MVSYVHDSRNNLFNPTRGLYLDNSYELAGGFLSGTDAFSRAISRVRYFYPLDRHTVVATAFRIGWMDTFGNSRPVPLNERFFTGGPNTMRGFGYQRVGPIDENDEPVGGKFEIIWNAVEIRRVVYKMFGVVVFVDVGNVWSRAKEFRMTDVRVDAGPGLRANTPLGIVRLDYGVNLDRRPGESRAKLYLSMGQAF
jgi:outer membrane protein insertion porin family